MTSELSPVILRGVATSGVNLGIAVGQLLSNSVIKGFGSRTDRWAYRGPFAVQLAFVALLLVGYPWAPESPVYLVKTGRLDDARKALRRVWGDSVDLTAKVAALEATISKERAAGHHKPSFMDCFRDTNRIRTIISTGVFVCQHAVGIIFVLGYSSCEFAPSLFRLFECRRLTRYRLFSTSWTRCLELVRPRYWRDRLRCRRE